MGDVVFQQGSLKIGEGIKLFTEHDMTRPIGKLSRYEEDDKGIVGTFKIARTNAGDDALAEAQEGLRTGFSVGAMIDNYVTKGEQVIVNEATLREVSQFSNADVLLTPFSVMISNASPVAHGLGVITKTDTYANNNSFLDALNFKTLDVICNNKIASAKRNVYYSSGRTIDKRGGPMDHHPEDQALSNRNSRGGRVQREYAEVLRQQIDAKRRAGV